jgi:hypothetical protein
MRRRKRIQTMRRMRRRKLRLRRTMLMKKENSFLP